MADGKAGVDPPARARASGEATRRRAGRRKAHLADDEELAKPAGQAGAGGGIFQHDRSAGASHGARDLTGCRDGSGIAANATRASTPASSRSGNGVRGTKALASAAQFARQARRPRPRTTAGSRSAFDARPASGWRPPPSAPRCLAGVSRSVRQPRDVGARDDQHHATTHQGAHHRQRTLRAGAPAAGRSRGLRSGRCTARARRRQRRRGRSTHLADGRGVCHPRMRLQPAGAALRPSPTSRLSVVTGTNTSSTMAAAGTAKRGRAMRQS